MSTAQTIYMTEPQTDNMYPLFTQDELQNLDVDTEVCSTNPNTEIVFNRDRTIVKFLWPGSSIEMLVGPDVLDTNYKRQDEIDVYIRLLDTMVKLFGLCYSKIVGSTYDFTDTELNFYSVLRLFSVYNVWYSGPVYNNDSNARLAMCKDFLYSKIGLKTKDIDYLNMITYKAHKLYRVFLHKSHLARNVLLSEFTI